MISIDRGALPGVLLSLLAALAVWPTFGMNAAGFLLVGAVIGSFRLDR